MLERLTVYLENQDFCVPGYQWIPEYELITSLSKRSESCKDLCYRVGLVCEPEFFPIVQSNMEAFLKRFVNAHMKNH